MTDINRAFDWLKAHGFVEKADWSTKDKNDLPDSAFLVVEHAYDPNKKGLSDKNARHLPVFDENGKINHDHLANAAARVNQIKSVLGKESDEEIRARAMKRLRALAKEHMPNSELNKKETEKADGGKSSCAPMGGEKEHAFMSRCMDHMVNERGKAQEAAVGACLGIWDGGGGKGANKADDSKKKDMKDRLNALIDELVNKGYTKETATEIAGKVLWGMKNDTGAQLESETNIKEEDWPFSPSDTTPEKEHMIGCLKWATQDQLMDPDKAVEVCTGMWPSSGPWSVPSKPAW